MADETDGQFDSTAFEHTKTHCAELKQNHSKRNSIDKEMDKLYWMEWDEESTVKKQIKQVKLTKSPRARIVMQGAQRLLLASDPQFSVPKDINNPETIAVSDKLETFAKAMWFAAGRIKGDPIHYDIVRSGLLYSEIHIRVTSTRELAEYAKGSNPAMQARAEFVAQKTPYLFEVNNPQEGYPEFGPLGLQAFFRSVNTTSGYILDNWGKRGELALREAKSNRGEVDRYTSVVLNDFYDFRDRVVWIDGSDRPIYQEAHGLPFIPVVAQIVEGSLGLFQKPDQQREPFMYSLYKSGVINRQNLFLTVLYSLIYAVGANPMFVNYLLDPDNPPPVDYNTPGGSINLRVGERREPMAKQVIDPALMQGWEIANTLEQESTIYRQSLGEPLGIGAPYSMVALLSQSGRLPLTVPQRKSGWAISEAVDIALKWLVHGKRKKVKAYDQGMTGLIDYKDIPKHFEIDVALEIQLPQDRLNAANAANALAAGDDPMVSKSWVRENVLNVGQSDAMTKEIWREKAAELFWQKFFFDQMAKIAQMKQAAMTPTTPEQGTLPGQPGQGPLPQPGTQPNPMPEPPIEGMQGMLPNQMPMGGNGNGGPPPEEGMM